MKRKFIGITKLLSLSLSLSLSVVIFGNSKIICAAEHTHTDECCTGELHVHSGTPYKKSGCYQGDSTTVECPGTLYASSTDYDSICNNHGVAYTDIRCNICYLIVSICVKCAQDQSDYYYEYRPGSECSGRTNKYELSCKLKEGAFYDTEFDEKHKDCTHLCGGGLVTECWALGDSVHCPKCGKKVHGSYYSMRSCSRCRNGQSENIIEIHSHSDCDYTSSIPDDMGEFGYDYRSLNCLHGCKLVNNSEYILTAEDCVREIPAKCAKVVIGIIPKT